MEFSPLSFELGLCMSPSRRTSASLELDNFNFATTDEIIIFVSDEDEGEDTPFLWSSLDVVR